MFKFWQDAASTRAQRLMCNAEALYEWLADEEIVLTEEPITTQIPLKPLIGREVVDAASLIACYLKTQDVNVANHHGLTLLHHLILNQRYDLAPPILHHPEFTKINYKACYKSDKHIIYASAFDMVLVQWLQGEGGIDLHGIVLMLLYGAQPPDPLASFYDGSLINYLYPALLLKRSQGAQPDEVVTLLAILHAYGFAFDRMEADFRERLWGERAGARQFAQLFHVSEEEQLSLFDTQMARVRQSMRRGEVKGELLVTLDNARLDDGEFSLRLPFKTVGRPCLLM